MNNARTWKLLGLAAIFLMGCMAFGLGTARSEINAALHKLERIVSLNLCVDEMVLRLAQRRNIASITWASRDADYSNVAHLAQGLPVNHGLAEEIIPLRPDLVIAGIYTTRAAVSILQRAGVPTMDVNVPRTFDEVRRQYREVAAVLGEQARGESVIAEMEDRLVRATAIVSQTSPRPRAIVFNPNGYTISRGSLVDEIITRAGLENIAATLGLAEYSQIPLEVVAMSGVDVLIVSSRRDGPSAIATELLRHPVLSRLSSRTRIVAMPDRLWDCYGPGLADAVELLARAGVEFRNGTRGRAGVDRE